MHLRLLTLLLALACVLPAAAQAPFAPNEGAQLLSHGGGDYTFIWKMRAQYMYYLSWSSDIATWHYFPYLLIS